MARETQIFSISLTAAADLSSSQFCGVAIDTSGDAALPSANADIIGVVQNKPTAGQIATVCVLGRTKGLVGAGGVTAGDALTITSAGAFVTAASSGRYIVGYAEDTAAAGNLTTVVLRSAGKN